ncbi:MAG: hypothetical protein LBB50_01545 [Oscillospiraceae bacterium]|jgi:hypothetical protein|nr:hypothetical protein [Oscillospiraceae bacterium]
MLTSEQLKQVKRTNVSVDSEKTKVRVAQVWKAAKVAQKQTARRLADVSAQTVYRVYNTGGISVKMALALAQSLNLNPLYLTGEADDPGKYEDAQARALLLKHGYQKLVASTELPNKQKEPYAAKPVEKPKPVAPEETIAPPEPPIADSELPEEDFVILFRALGIQSKAGVPAARARLAQIKQLLIV